jgi:hypothetical protein
MRDGVSLIHSPFIVSYTPSLTDWLPPRPLQQFT